MEYIEGRKILRSRLEDVKNECMDCFKGQPAMTEIGEKIRCERCLTEHVKKEVRLPAGYYYCPACILLGRVTSQDQLIFGAASKKTPRKVHLAWQGTLTVSQRKIADDLKVSGTHLVWAVAGAGKTEMLFPVIQTMLAVGGRVGIVSPRIDVCNELAPRLAAAFPEEAYCLLHSGSKQRYQNEKLIICTTHQLLHFDQAFDLLILDEADAFPYEGDLMLETAVQNARKNPSSLIYLTATPSNYLRENLPADTKEHRLPVRYHRRPLPIPRLVWWQRIERDLQRQRLPQKLLALIHSLAAENHLLIFCPSIPLIIRLHQLLKKYFSDTAIEAVWAKEADRIEKVYRMRSGEYDILLSTTILERGVTFESISVLIIKADHTVFTKSALVQIAGRADRKGSHRNGEVVFVISEWTLAIEEAVQEIKENNRLGKEQGLLDDL